MGIKYILFLQDDCFIKENITKKYCDDIFNIIKTTDFKIINLETKVDTILPDHSQREKLLLNVCGDIKIYKTDTEKTLWGDYPFIADINYLLNEVYDDDYFNEKDIWWAEFNLSRKLLGDKKIEMYSLNIPLYSRRGLCGRSGHEHFKDNIKKLTDELVHKNKSFHFSQDYFSKNIKTSMKILIRMFGNNKNNILEIGSHEGRSTTFMLQHLCNHKDSSFLSIDPYNMKDKTCNVYNDTKNIFLDNIKLCYNYEKFKQINGYSSEELKKIVEENKTFNIIYIDGSHLYDDVKSDIYYSDKLLEIDGVIIVDDVGIKDIDGYVDVRKACTEFINSHPNYHLILESYQWILIKIK